MTRPGSVRGFSEGHQCPNCPELSRTLLRLHRILPSVCRRRTLRTCDWRRRVILLTPTLGREKTKLGLLIYNCSL